MSSRARTRSVLASALCLAWGAVVGAEPSLVARPRPIAGLNPFVLTNLVSSKVVVEIDWVEGSRPSEVSAPAIRELLGEVCEQGKRVEIRMDDEIPRSAWQAAAGRTGLEGLVARFLDGDPTSWRQAEVIYLLYAPNGDAWYQDSPSGITDRVIFNRGGRIESVNAVLLFTEQIRRDATMWITKRKVERATIVHELGHVLGLVDNPGHMQRKHPGHCNAARCVMHRPGVRAALANGLPAFFGGRIPSRLGPRCREDIAAAKRAWTEQAGSSDGFVDRLIAERRLSEAHAAEAWQRSRKP